MTKESLERLCRSALQTLQQAVANYSAETGELPYFLLDHVSKELPQALLDTCTVHSSRYQMMQRIGAQGKVIELGTQTGAFARFLIDTLSPAELHVVDIDYSLFRHELFKEKDRAILKIHEGSSWDVAASFAPGYFDLAYIDASHAYEHVTKDLQACVKAVKPGGLIVCNDFVSWSPFEAVPYGVPKAVTELIAQHGFVVKHLALHPMGYHDIAFQTTPTTTTNQSSGL
jgi:SAM-dependent methyltransferase